MGVSSLSQWGILVVFAKLGSPALVGHLVYGLARKAKELLEAAGGRLLGTVLHNRSFPVPEQSGLIVIIGESLCAACFTLVSFTRCPAFGSLERNHSLSSTAPVVGAGY